MPEERTNQVPPNGRISFKTGLVIYVVSEAVAIGVLIYHLLQR